MGHSYGRKWNRQLFDELSFQTHGAMYDYSRVGEITKAAQRVTIICQTHGEFTQEARNHASGGKCPQCNRNGRKTTKTFISEATTKHGELYDYSKSTYKSAHDLITIICPVHGDFEQRAKDHTLGRGCYECNIRKGTGYTEKYFELTPELKDERGFLYSMKLTSSDEVFWKVGITRNVDNRIMDLRRVYDVELLEVQEMTLYDAFLVEQSILLENKNTIINHGLNLVDILSVSRNK